MANTPSANPQDKRQYFEQRLRQRQQELEQAVANTVEQALSSNTDDTRDVADQAVAGYQKELLFSQGSVRSSQLRSGAPGTGAPCGGKLRRLRSLLPAHRRQTHRGPSLDAVLHQLPGADRAR